MPEKAVSDPTRDKTLKPKKPARADEPLHADEGGLMKAKKEKKPKPEKEPKKPYINKYGFLHINGKLAEHLGVEFGKDKADVPVRIEEVPNGFVVKILKA